MPVVDIALVDALAATEGASAFAAGTGALAGFDAAGSGLVLDEATGLLTDGVGGFYDAATGYPVNAPGFDPMSTGANGLPESGGSPLQQVGQDARMTGPEGYDAAKAGAAADSTPTNSFGNALDSAEQWMKAHPMSTRLGMAGGLSALQMMGAKASSKASAKNTADIMGRQATAQAARDHPDPYPGFNGAGLQPQYPTVPSYAALGVAPLSTMYSNVPARPNADGGYIRRFAGGGDTGSPLANFADGLQIAPGAPDARSWWSHGGPGSGAGTGTWDPNSAPASMQGGSPLMAASNLLQPSWSVLPNPTFLDTSTIVPQAAPPVAQSPWDYWAAAGGDGGNAAGDTGGGGVGGGVGDAGPGGGSPEAHGGKIDGPMGGLGAMRDDAQVGGHGGGQQDNIPAMLSPKEYVLDADIVSAVGDGNPDEGAKKLDAWRENVRRHKRSAPAHKIPPKARPIDSYFRKAA